MMNAQAHTITPELLRLVLTEQHEYFEQDCQNLGVERQVLGLLGAAIDSPQVVVITGLRRVGKSTLLAQIAAKHLQDDYYYVSFEDERLINFQASQFDMMYETLVSLRGEKKIFLLDEVQNIPEWERFVRRFHDQGFKFFVTGSNASLLSRELGTRLTGRSVRVELFPFSFAEYLKFKKKSSTLPKTVTTKQKGILNKLLEEYLATGGIPDALKYPDLDIHQTLYDDVLYRDIATRYKIDNVKSLRELAFYLSSNSASLASFNKIKQHLRLGSVNTVSKYVGYLEESWLIFILNKHAYSVKEQQIASKKIYGVDTGMINSVGFSFSKNTGRLLENLVYLQLRRKNPSQRDLYYLKTSQGHEIDFFLPKKGELIQVAQQVAAPDILSREVRSLQGAAQETQQKGKKLKKLLLVQHEPQGLTEAQDLGVEVVPLYRWLLEE